MPIAPGDEYVAMGSSFAAGPLLSPRDRSAPLAAGRSRANAAHLVAAALELRLTDATFSGATTADMLARGLGKEAPQVERVGPATRLVTVTSGGNDVGYVPTLAAGAIRRFRRHPIALPAPDATDAAFEALASAQRGLAQRIRATAPEALVVFVDYLTILPADERVDTGRLPAEVADWGRATARRLSETTRRSAGLVGCAFVAASEASGAHDAWSADPWTNGPRFSFTAGAPWHPRHKGMRAVADLVVERIRQEG